MSIFIDNFFSLASIPKAYSVLQNVKISELGRSAFAITIVSVAKKEQLVNLVRSENARLFIEHVAKEWEPDYTGSAIEQVLSKVYEGPLYHFKPGDLLYVCETNAEIHANGVRYFSIEFEKAMPREDV